MPGPGSFSLMLCRIEGIFCRSSYLTTLVIDAHPACNIHAARSVSTRKRNPVVKHIDHRGAPKDSRAWGRVIRSFAAGGLICLALAPNSNANSLPCTTSPESHQFDFWLGDWAVSYPGMSSGSASTVTLALDKCLLLENWDGGKGHSGMNVFAYDANDKTWRGMFADNQGRVHVFEGKVQSGVAEFYGPSRDQDGVTSLNRIRVIRLSPASVEQSWEKSMDNGSTWRVEFRGKYQRKEP
jgi:hypothetical protein